MSQKRRKTRYESLAIILEGTTSPIAITALFYKTESSYSRLKSLLNLAVRCKLVRKIGGLYQVTQKGQAYLEKWREIQSLLSEA